MCVFVPRASKNSKNWALAKRGLRGKAISFRSCFSFGECYFVTIMIENTMLLCCGVLVMGV